ncbi:A/G-specific adenine glycosylase [Aerococcaceae bacterium WGS1372]
MTSRKNKLIKKYPIPWNQSQINSFRVELLDWYDQNRRDLPWRQTKNPYYIWVSEIMLQQTQVNTVIPYYLNFIHNLPTIKDLAEVEEAKLMILWQGLGYYSRVRNMQQAAQHIMTNYQGQMPSTLDELLTLKGIGPYTAGAIASIAFNQAEPALDGNLMRIVARLFEIDGDITLNATKNQMTAFLYQMIDPKRPGDFNQALMDIGATIMTPKNYRPDNHPLIDFDQSYHNGTSHLYPVKKKKLKATSRHLLAYAIRNTKGQWLMQQHSDKELLTGLWHFPMVEVNMVMEAATQSELMEPLFEHFTEADIFPVEYEDIRISVPTDYEQLELFNRFPEVKHVFSHRIWHVQVVPIVATKFVEVDNDQYQWVDVQALEGLAISTLQKKLFDTIAFDRYETEL